MSDKTSVLKGPKDVVTKVRNVTRSMTTGTALATLPRGSRLIGFAVTGVASDAGTTATLSFGNSATATEYCASANVLAAGVGNGGFIGSLSGAVLTSDTTIYAKYAESGAASNAGAWKVAILYTQSNHVNDDTI